MSTIKIAVSQFKTIDGDVRFNMCQVEKMIHKIMNEKNVDIMLFCEECVDNFGNNERMNAEYTDEKIQEVQEFWTNTAKMAGFAIISGFVGKNNQGKWQNYCACFTPEGKVIGKYAKSHLYKQERENFVPGDDPVVFEYKGWRIAPLICADLGFPEWSRIQAYKGVDLFCVPSCWAYPHDELWVLCNRLRAAENAAYLVSCNRYGEESGKRLNLGTSMAVNPKGEIIADLGIAQEGYFTANLSKDVLTEKDVAHEWLDWGRPDLYKTLV